MSDLNRVTITGRLTRDPELWVTNGGTTICKLGVAVNNRVKQPDGSWGDYANFLEVTVFGSRAENAAKYLGRGRPIAVDGRLRWSSWTDQTGQKRSKVEIVADSIVYLGSKDDQQRAPAGSPAVNEAGLEVPDEAFDSDIPF